MKAYCLKCAQESGQFTQIDQAVKQMGISDEDLDMLSDEMSSHVRPEGRQRQTLSDDEIDSQTATFPLLNQLFRRQQYPRAPAPSFQKGQKESRRKRKSPSGINSWTAIAWT